MARKRATVALAGRRTGVQIQDRDAAAAATTSSSEQSLHAMSQDMDAAFDNAISPPHTGKENTTAAAEKKNSDARRVVATAAAAAKQQRSVRFSLEGQNVTTSRGGAAVNGTDSEETPASYMESKLSRLRKTSLSPSELSKVSTAPPLPVQQSSSPENEEEEEEDIEQARHAVAEATTPMAQTTQESTQQDNDDDDNHLGGAEADDDEDPVAHQDDDDDDMMPPPPDDDDDDDDMIPPPPDSPVPEEEEEEVPTQAADQTPVDFPTQLGEQDDFDDDDDDDDREGVGFQMAEQPEDEEEEPAAPSPDDDEEEEEEEPVITPAPSRKKLPTKKNAKSAKSTKSSKSSKTAKSAKTTKSKAKKKKAAPKRKPAAATPTDAEETPEPQPKKRGRKKKNNKRPPAFSPKGMQSGPLEYEHIPVVSNPKTPREEKGLRRSKRTKIQPLAFWKGEKAEYGPTDLNSDNLHGGLQDSLHSMSEVVRYNKALPTPYKPRPPPRPRAKEPPTTAKKKKKGGRGGAKQAADDDSTALVAKAAAPDPSTVPFDTSKLRKKYKYMDGDMAYVWDDGYENSDQLNVVAYKRNLESRPLPVGKRRKGESKVVGSASQAFNVATENPFYPGYIMGHLHLPARGIKDAESVGSCAQTFTVVSCQPQAIEVAYGDPDEDDGALDPNTAQRFLLESGDMFRVPPGNCYRLQNHSKEVDCFLTWTIIRSNPAAGGDGDSM